MRSMVRPLPVRTPFRYTERKTQSQTFRFRFVRQGRKLRLARHEIVGEVALRPSPVSQCID